MRVNTHSLTFLASAAMGPFLRVKLSSGKLVAAGAEDRELGTLEQRVLAADDPAAVVPRNAEGTVRMVAAGAVTQFATVYGAASGKVSATPNGNPIGMAMTAAAADGNYIEVFRFQSQPIRTAEDHTADDTLTAAESGTIHTTVGATGTVTLTLPSATPGLELFFRVGAAQELRLDPDGSETIALPSTGVQGAAGKYLTANAAGESLHIMCDTAGQWTVYGYTGTWTAEA